MRYRANETIAALSVAALVGMFIGGNELVITPLRGTAAEPIPEVKYLGGFIFEVLAAWSGVSGYIETDPVAEMIERI